MEDQKLQTDECEILLKYICLELKKSIKLKSRFNLICETAADIKFEYQTQCKLIESAIKEVDQNNNVLTDEQRCLFNKLKEANDAMKNVRYSHDIEDVDIQTSFERFCVDFKKTDGVNLLQGYYNFVEAHMKD